MDAIQAERDRLYADAHQVAREFVQDPHVMAAKRASRGRVGNQFMRSIPNMEFLTVDGKKHDGRKDHAEYAARVTAIRDEILSNFRPRATLGAMRAFVSAMLFPRHPVSKA